jgi:hypothetical protein
MKYFNLSREEITIMRILTRKRFFPYLLSFLLSLFIIFICYTQIIKNSNYNFMSSNSFLILISGFTLMLFLIHFIYTSDIIQTFLKKNQRVIYTGVLGEKKIKENTNYRKYVFYMDGMKFSVNEMDFQSFNSGDLVEFHVSLNSKHLIKISRRSSEFSSK